MSGDYNSSVGECFPLYPSEYSDTQGMIDPDPDHNEADQQFGSSFHDVNDVGQETHTEEELENILSEFKIPLRPRSEHHSCLLPDFGH